MGFNWILTSCNDHPAQIRNIDKWFRDKLDIKSSARIGDIYKVGKKDSIGISAFGYKKRKVFALCVEKGVNLLLSLENKNKKHYILIETF